MKVATKLSAAFCLLIVVLAGSLVYHVRTNRSAVSASFELAELSSRASLTNSRQIAAINQLQESAEKYWVTRDEGYLTLFEEAYLQFEGGLVELTANADSPREQEEVQILQALWSNFRPVAERVGSDVLLTDPPAVELAPRLAALRQQTRRVTDASQAAMSERLEASASALRQAERISWLVGAGTLLLMVAVFTVIVRAISSGLTRLQKGTHKVAIGDFSYRIPMSGGDEFAQLASDFNVMTVKLGELDRMKRNFLSKVSHDLKTPLASMRETVQLMLDGVPGPVNPRQERLLELTNESARRLSLMIAKILDLSAMEAGALALDVGEHEAEELMERAIEALALGDPAKIDRIACDPPDAPLHIACDRERIVQVLVNLLENAVKFTDEAFPVRISARHVTADDPALPRDHRKLLPRGDSVGAIVEVTDRGPGVPNDEKRRIFEDFYQSAAGGKARGRGVGLGLAICRELVDLHGGAVWVRDNPEGGSIFTLLLPRARVEIATTEPRTAGLEITSAAG